MDATTDHFDQTIDELMAREFAESPRLAAGVGRDGFDDRLDDLSASAHERREREDGIWLQRFDRFDPSDLSVDQAIDRDLVISRLRVRRALSGWEEWRRSPEAYLETGITELFLMAIRSEDELTDSAVARLHGIGAVLEDAARNLDPSLASRLIVERGLAECVANIGFARDEVALLASEPANRERLRSAGEVGARAYERFAGFLEELAPTCTGTYVLGEDRYNAVLQQGELLDTDVRSLRQQGWDEYHRVADQMTEVASRLEGGVGDWPEVIRGLQQVHAPSVEGMRAEYEATCARARRFMTEAGLVTDPPDERCHVVPAPPAVRATLAVACYIAPPMFKPSRTGHFFVPYPVDERRCRGDRRPPREQCHLLDGHHRRARGLPRAPLAPDDHEGGTPGQAHLHLGLLRRGMGPLCRGHDARRRLPHAPGGVGPARGPPVPGRPHRRRHLAAHRGDVRRRGGGVHAREGTAADCRPPGRRWPATAPGPPRPRPI